ncbi:glutamate dehydrogenase, partial [human gut metagenome]
MPSRIKTYLCIRNEFHFVKTLNANYYGYQSNHDLPGGKHPGESEYLQAVKEVLLSIEDIYNQHPEFEKASLIERLVEPDRIFTFKVP